MPGCLTLFLIEARKSELAPQQSGDRSPRLLFRFEHRRRGAFERRFNLRGFRPRIRNRRLKRPRDESSYGLRIRVGVTLGIPENAPLLAKLEIKTRSAHILRWPIFPVSQ
jgi:hypothetical protein